MIQCANVSFDPGCINRLICRMNKQPGGYITSPCLAVVICHMLGHVNNFVRPKSLNDVGEGLHVFTKFIWSLSYTEYGFIIIYSD